jgi:hypothetical protein
VCGRKKEGDMNHGTVEVGLATLRSVCHEGELGYTQDFSLYFFNVGFPHGTGGMSKSLES